MIKKPQGMLDFFPEETAKIQYIEAKARNVAARFGFGEIRTPVLENTELFARGVGNTTDVVQKEMYTFIDRDGPSLSLRPEGTASVARAIIENGKYGDAMPLKYYYLINCYRHERQQKGRYREFSQFGVEMYGSGTPAADASIIALADTLIKELKIQKVELHVNTIGCKNCRPAYYQKLREYFSARKDELCDTCKSRLETNPMRILDCKSEICKRIAKDAPKAIDHLCPECADHQKKVESYLKGMNIPFTLDTSIVRGLDYYSRTVFEFICRDERMGAQSTICGGGRYDGLLEEIGGTSLPACGFAIGITRLLPTVELPAECVKGIDLYIAPMGDAALEKAIVLVQTLRDAGYSADTDLVGRSLKAQMKYANKIGAAYTLVLGDDEILAGKAVLKNMRGEGSDEVNLDDLLGFAREHF
ncbi:MAG: histidine--tRNA ligase [Eubacteriales bacterium]